MFVAGPGVEILDLVGPLQVFARASEMHARENPGSPPIYSVEVATVSSSRSLIANCGVRITADRTFREVRGKIDTLLVAGGDAIEQNEINRGSGALVEKNFPTNPASRLGLHWRNALGSRGLARRPPRYDSLELVSDLDQTCSAYARRCGSDICPG